MSFRKMAKKKKEDLMKRHKESYESKDDKGGVTGSIFIKEKIPEGMSFWNAEMGEHIIDILPFKAGKNHPKEKELAYVCDLWVHRNIGALRDQFVCPARNFKKACPICEFIAKERLPEKEWNRIRPYRRTVYLVWVHDQKEQEKEKGAQIWEVAHWFFEKPVDEIAKKKRGGGYVVFSDMDTGKSISFTVAKSGSYEDADGVKRDSIEFTGFSFEDREDSIPDEILDNLLCGEGDNLSLDQIIHTPSYDEVSEAFHGGMEKKKNVETEPETEEKPEPEKEKDEPEKEKEEITKGECPHGHEFGVDIEKKPECDECLLWDDCSDDADKRTGK